MRFAVLSLFVLFAFTGTNAFHLPIRELSSINNTVNFISFGDWGSDTDYQKNVAVALGALSATENPMFLFSLGDNFYEDGVTSDTDPQWQTKYSDVYSNPSLNYPWYALLGNHDHHLGHGQGEIDYYLNKRDNRWFLPYWWYAATWSATTSDGQKFTIEGVFIDTVLLFGGDDSGVNQTQVKEQTDWIVKTLSSSTADWLFVSGHYPTYSGGEHGTTQGMVDTFKPYFEQYGVDAYFCGHDHTLQHLEENNVHYIVSGNAGKVGTYEPIPQSVYGIVDPGFGIHYLNSTHLITRFIDSNQKEVYIYTQPRNPKPWEKRETAKQC